MVKNRILFIAFLLALVSGCVQSLKETPEFINAPVNLKISLVATQTYSLSFQSDNREGGFAGYGVFIGSSSESVSQEPGTAITAATLFCS